MLGALPGARPGPARPTKAKPQIVCPGLLLIPAPTLGPPASA